MGNESKLSTAFVNDAKDSILVSEKYGLYVPNQSTYNIATIAVRVLRHVFIKHFLERNPEIEEKYMKDEVSIIEIQNMLDPHGNVYTDNFKERFNERAFRELAKEWS